MDRLNGTLCVRCEGSGTVTQGDGACADCNGSRFRSPEVIHEYVAGLESKLKSMTEGGGESSRLSSSDAEAERDAAMDAAHELKSSLEASRKKVDELEREAARNPEAEEEKLMDCLGRLAGFEPSGDYSCRENIAHAIKAIRSQSRIEARFFKGKEDMPYLILGLEKLLAEAQSSNADLRGALESIPGCGCAEYIPCLKCKAIAATPADSLANHDKEKAIKFGLEVERRAQKAAVGAEYSYGVGSAALVSRFGHEFGNEARRLQAGPQKKQEWRIPVEPDPEDRPESND